MKKDSIQAFVEDAIYGGWRADDPMQSEYFDMVGYVAFLDPEMWKAVGRTRAWPVIKMIDVRRGSETSQHYWLYQQHRFIDALADGKSLSESLDSIN